MQTFTRRGGRNALFATLEDLESAFHAEFVADGGYTPRDNIAPGEPLEVITNEATDELDRYHWGLPENIRFGSRFKSVTAVCYREAELLRISQVYARAVGSTLADAASEREVRAARKQLPGPFGVVFDPPAAESD